MPKSPANFLRWLRLLLVVLVGWHLGRAGFRVFFLSRLKIPAAPTLVAEKPAVVKAPPMAGATVAPTRTNAAATTNLVAVTNAAAATNSLVAPVSSAPAATNAEAAPNPDAVAPPGPTTNGMVGAGTNGPTDSAAIPGKTNVITEVTGSNLPALKPGAIAGTNAPPVPAGSNAPGPAPLAGKDKVNRLVTGPVMVGGGFPSSRPSRPGLKPEEQAKVDQIVSSEILGPVMHPLPMALLGIAGDVAFIRTPSGQSGMVKMGDSLGEIKLLRIGINRVLVEENGLEKELMIFDGYGGDSLLPKPSEKLP